MTLEDFVAQSHGAPFAWGVNDCALWCASAVVACIGVDPAADLRGTYSSWIECRHVLQRAGGLVNLTAPRMAAIEGLQPLAVPLAEDARGVAVVRVGAQVLCAIILDQRAILRSARGVRVVDDFKLLVGWTCRRF